MERKTSNVTKATTETLTRIQNILPTEPLPVLSTPVWAKQNAFNLGTARQMNRMKSLLLLLVESQNRGERLDGFLFDNADLLYSIDRWVGMKRDSVATLSLFCGL